MSEGSKHDDRGERVTDEAVAALGARRWRIALALSAVMFATYFGFLLLVAYGKTMLGSLVFPGLSVGILLGALVIVVAWVLTGIYVRWANETYDAALDELRKTIDQPASRSPTGEGDA